LIFAEYGFQASKEILAIVVVLIVHADFRAGLVLEDVLPERFALHLEPRIHRHAPGEILLSHLTVGIIHGQQWLPPEAPFDPGKPVRSFKAGQA
jgi:hypothetical protein